MSSLLTSPALRGTVGEALRWGETRLSESHIETARREALWILQACFREDVGSAWIYTRLDEPLAIDVQKRYRHCILKRSERVPLAYLLGEQDFLGRTFRVRAGALIPRPETEILARAAIERLRALQAPLALDLGTGTACIAVSLALEAPNASVVAVDLSDEALELAAENARLHAAHTRVRFMHSDGFNGLARFRGAFDVIASNPPYISSFELPGLQPELRHEPALALDGGPDGLRVIRRIVSEAPAYLKPDGFLMLEIGYDQPQRVRALLADQSYRDVSGLGDGLGHERVILARRPWTRS